MAALETHPSELIRSSHDTSLPRREIRIHRGHPLLLNGVTDRRQIVFFSRARDNGIEKRTETLTVV